MIWSFDFFIYLGFPPPPNSGNCSYCSGEPSQSSREVWASEDYDLLMLQEFYLTVRLVQVIPLYKVSYISRGCV